MAKVVMGDPTIFSAMVYGQEDPRLTEYVQTQWQSWSNRLNDVGNQFIQRAADFHEGVRNSNAMRVARAAMRRVSSLWGTNEIREIREVWQVQNAPDKMVRWIMASPTIRNLYHQQRCDGYSGRYIDVQPNKRGVEHDDYRILMSGMLVETENDWEITTWANDIDHVDDNLSFEDKVVVLDAIELAEAAISQGIDPTSKWDDDLG